MHAHEGADGGVGAAQLHGHQAVDERPATGAAGCVVGQARDAELGDLRDQVVRELGPDPVVVDHRLDDLVHEAAHAAQQLAVLLLEEELEAEEVGEGGVVRVQDRVGARVAHGCSASVVVVVGEIGSGEVRKSSMIGASSSLSVTTPRWPPR